MESEMKGLLRKVSERLELPASVIAGLPTLTLTGFTEAALEYHAGIREYDPSRITVEVSLGTVCLEGEGLSIHQMNSEQIVVRGNIRSITLKSEVTP
jgi:sporulation protein YqfC